MEILEQKLNWFTPILYTKQPILNSSPLIKKLEKIKQMAFEIIDSYFYFGDLVAEPLEGNRVKLVDVPKKEGASRVIYGLSFITGVIPLVMLVFKWFLRYKQVYIIDDAEIQLLKKEIKELDKPLIPNEILKGIPSVNNSKDDDSVSLSATKEKGLPNLEKLPSDSNSEKKSSFELEDLKDILDLNKTPTVNFEDIQKAIYNLKAEQAIEFLADYKKSLISLFDKDNKQTFSEQKIRATWIASSILTRLNQVYTERNVDFESFLKNFYLNYSNLKDSIFLIRSLKLESQTKIKFGKEAELMLKNLERLIK